MPRVVRLPLSLIKQKLPVQRLLNTSNTSNSNNTMLVHSVEKEVKEAFAVVTNAPVPSSDIDQPLKVKTTIPEADHDIITLAQERYQHNKILEAYRLLQSVKNKSLLDDPKVQEICNAAIECQNAISDLLDEPDHTAPGSTWKKQGESHGEYETTVSYKASYSGSTRKT